MSTVTVAGANGQTVVLTFDTEANAALAQRIASAITAGVQNGSILASDDSTGPPLPLPPGATGEFVQTKDGMTALPPGYKAFIDTAAKAVVFGSGDADEFGAVQRRPAGLHCYRRFRNRGCRRRQ